MIKEIPAGFGTTSQQMKNLPELSGPITFTGNGTAFYASVMGSQILGLTKVPWRAIQGFELAHYESLTEKGTVVGVSHSGITSATVDPLQRAKLRGALTIGLTHFTDRPISRVAERTFVIGNGPDKSRCHTKAYTDSAAAVLKIALEQARSSGSTLTEIEREFDGNLLDKLTRTVRESEEPARKAAQELSSIKKMFFVGGGPNLVTAREAALKVKETSYLAAEGIELEEFQHGSWMALDREALVIAIAPEGPVRERTESLIGAARKIGAKTMVVTDASFEADYVLRFPDTPEYLSPFLGIVPLYFLSYFLAVGKGNNPDYLRYLDPSYWAARQFVFPPGTH
jgi:glucosamine--fructose-6-phosphate aminotransferase (isomerizing)